MNRNFISNVHHMLVDELTMIKRQACNHFSGKLDCIIEQLANWNVMLMEPVCEVTAVVFLTYLGTKQMGSNISLGLKHRSSRIYLWLRNAIDSLHKCYFQIPSLSSLSTSDDGMHIYDQLELRYAIVLSVIKPENQTMPLNRLKVSLPPLNLLIDETIKP